jgi:hypothetical protein
VGNDNFKSLDVHNEVAYDRPVECQGQAVSTDDLPKLAPA